MIVVVAALVFGLVVLGLLSRFAGNVPRVDSRTVPVASDTRPPIRPRDFEAVIRGLLGALGLEVVSVSADPSGALKEMICRDPRPLAGGRLLVRASAVTAGGQIDAAEVLMFADSVRADMGALKGIDIAAAGFTDEAYAAAEATPAQIELIDARKLVELVREHVPDRSDLLERHRSFSTDGRRHGRAAGHGHVEERPASLQ